MVKSVESARDVGSFKGLQWKNILSTFETVQLMGLRSNYMLLNQNFLGM